MSPQHPFLRSLESAEARGDRALGQDLDNIFRLTAGGAAPEPARARAAPEARRVTQSDLDGALDMLNRASKAMDLMQSRYQHVEDYARGVAERAEKDVAAAQAQAREWESRASGQEGRLEEMRLRAEAAERRASAAERRAEAAEGRLEAAEHGAREAREWLERFYDKIVGAFDSRAFLRSQAA